MSFLFFISSNRIFAQRCLSQKLLRESISSDVYVEEYRLTLENQTRNWIENSRNDVSLREVATINVVVHIVWHQLDEMISEEQVLSQIDVLNEDFRKQNANINIVNFPGFVNVMADMEIEFQLAAIDPLGSPTSGIIYYQTQIPQIASLFSDGKRRICYTNLGGADAWCNDNYLNIWVGAFAGGVLGEASFPGQESNNPEEDGIRITPKAFGRTANLQEPYHLGRTLTHEIGHYFNLFHLWGDSGNDPPNLDCQGDDEVEDTPQQAFNYRNTCYTTIHQSCGTPDMHFNYMTFTDDACMAMFTEGQKLRALAAINLSRPGLLNPTGCIVSVQDNRAFSANISMYPNPVKNQFSIFLKGEEGAHYSMKILNTSGQQITEEVFLKNGINTLSLGHLKNGFYLVKISDREHFLVEKIVIVH